MSDNWIDKAIGTAEAAHSEDQAKRESEQRAYKTAQLRNSELINSAEAILTEELVPYDEMLGEIGDDLAQAGISGKRHQIGYHHEATIPDFETIYERRSKSRAVSPLTLVAEYDSWNEGPSTSHHHGYFSCGLTIEGIGIVSIVPVLEKKPVDWPSQHFTSLRLNEPPVNSTMPLYGKGENYIKYTGFEKRALPFERRRLALYLTGKQEKPPSFSLGFKDEPSFHNYFVLSLRSVRGREDFLKLMHTTIGQWIAEKKAVELRHRSA